MEEKTLSVDIPEDLYKDFQEFVFSKRMEEHPNSKTTLKGTMAKALRFYLKAEKSVI